MYTAALRKLERVPLSTSRAILVCALLCWLPACAALQPNVVPEERYGHRVKGEDSEGRLTIAVTAPQEDTEYRLFDATFETVTVRPAAVSPETRLSGVPVEVLIKGAFPDACTELHEVTQQRAGNLVLVTLTMRRPQGSVCARVLRPYRFYLDLDGGFVTGSYSLRLNDTAHPFEVSEGSAS